jgi:hypothetical protein
VIFSYRYEVPRAGRKLLRSQAALVREHARIMRDMRKAARMKTARKLPWYRQPTLLGAIEKWRRGR